ncbi:NAD(P)H-dependent oxidoreductase [Methylovirgula sp. 4M-Z18]|uniref:NAD(P)H-dependent oxidoreductase n=1 Tax=Methylovirgula sp. 4M-Z18 TaxID=2293567 RepID=UPI000E2E5C7C|nr:NAD(P)H-dependent oxidoreductase [Methylovirgula sp. 4M-Z18]RFB76456.1 flavodoxin family protein [Methylovirgula sp. 4M-Z18]
MHILIVDGHPDPNEKRFCHAAAAAYAEGARKSGHEARVIAIAKLDIPVLRSQDEWVHGTLPPQLKEAQDAIKWADHLVIIYPLWLGDVPAYLKAFLEQVARPDFAFAPGSSYPTAGPLKGKSARLIVTMGMPAFVYRWFFFKHSVTSLKRNVLELVGIRPVRETIIGMVETTDHEKWLKSIKSLGQAAR